MGTLLAATRLRCRPFVASFGPLRRPAAQRDADFYLRGSSSFVRELTTGLGAWSISFDRTLTFPPVKSSGAMPKPLRHCSASSSRMQLACLLRRIQVPFHANPLCFSTPFASA